MFALKHRITDTVTFNNKEPKMKYVYPDDDFIEEDKKTNIQNLLNFIVWS